MRPTRLLASALALGAFLALPAAAQTPGELAPKSTIALVRFSSLDWLAKAKDILAKALDEDPSSVGLPFEDFHDGSGVDRKKPFYIFLAGGLQPMPWFALPVSDAQAFKNGLKQPVKPILKNGYAVLGPGLVMDTSAPEMGAQVPPLPDSGLVVHVMGKKALAAFQGQLMQIQMLANMVAGQASGGDPKKSRLIGAAVNTAFDLVKGLGSLEISADLGPSGKGQFAIRVTPQPGTALEGLVKALRPAGTPPPYLGENPFFWISAAWPPTSVFPKKIQGLLQALLGTPQGEGKAPGKSLLENIGSFAASLTPKGKLVVTFLQKAADPAALKPCLASKDKLLELVREIAPPMLSQEFGALLPSPEKLVRMAQVIPGAANLAGAEATALNVSMKPILGGLVPEFQAAAKGLFAGDKLHGLAALVDGKLALAFGPEGTPEKLLQGLKTAAASSVPPQALLAGAVDFGGMIQILKRLSPKKGEGKKDEASHLPQGKLHFAFQGDGKSVKLRLRGDLKDLLQAMKILKTL